ncbi:MAG: ERCC4 domain-containing protein, partial [bacterium]
MTFIKITCDFREKHSGIPKLLADNKVNVSFSSLSTGDYIINDQIIVERKTAEDFIQSIMDNRLFEQCSKLKKDSRRVLILMEG